MALFKSQMFFLAASGEGWSETYWQDVADGVAAITALGALVPLRMALMPLDFELIYAKVHLVTAPRKVFIIDTSTPIKGTFGPLLSTDTFHKIEEAVLVRKASNLGTVNHLFLHGIGSWVSNGDDLNPITSWLTAFSAFKTNLLSNWKIVSGFVHGIPANVEAIQSVIAERVTTHHVGRPFAAPRGRHLIRV